MTVQVNVVYVILACLLCLASLVSSAKDKESLGTGAYSECLGACDSEADSVVLEAQIYALEVVTRVCVWFDSDSLNAIALDFADGSKQSAGQQSGSQNCTMSLPKGGKECFDEVKVEYDGTGILGLQFSTSAGTESALLGSAGSMNTTLTDGSKCMRKMRVGIANNQVARLEVFFFEYFTRHLFGAHVYDVGNGIMAATLIGAFLMCLVCGILGCWTGRKYIFGNERA